MYKALIYISELLDRVQEELIFLYISVWKINGDPVTLVTLAYLYQILEDQW